ncbi:MAG: bifunctional nuclease family protein [Chloroflexota bacterium]|nr:bifunctional nuclease family protein [Chloroflexota bacterium]
MVEAVIEAIRVNVINDNHVVVLKEVDGPRVVPIWITNEVANSIALVLQGADVPRPLTHDLLRSVIYEMGGTVSRVVVNDLKDSIFHALIEIDLNGRRIQIDSRSSDAIALAVRTNSPIYVEDHVIDQAGFTMQLESPAETTEPEETPSPSQQLDPVETERLMVFREFVNNLDLDDPKRESE